MIIDRTEFTPSTDADMSAICAVHERAFGRTSEPELTQRLITGSDTTLDLCACIDRTIVGHGVLTELKGPEKAMALAPLAVDPVWRDFQIGTEIVRRLIAMARHERWKSIFVLGEPAYYGRFGFKSQLADNVKCTYQGKSFLALELIPGALSTYRGKLIYPSAFGELAA